jgi:hypothetical protein
VIAEEFEAAWRFDDVCRRVAKLFFKQLFYFNDRIGFSHAPQMPQVSQRVIAKKRLTLSPMRGSKLIFE